MQTIVSCWKESNKSEIVILRLTSEGHAEQYQLEALKKSLQLFGLNAQLEIKNGISSLDIDFTI